MHFNRIMRNETADVINSAKADRQAFTLVEVAVASALMIITLSSLLLAFNSARRSSYASANYIDAIAEARNEIESVSSDDYDEITDFGPRSVDSGVLAQMGGMLACTVEETNNYKSITITVTWTNTPTTECASLSISTLVSRD